MDPSNFEAKHLTQNETVRNPVKKQERKKS